MNSTSRGAAPLAAALLSALTLLTTAACAQPGQLGSPVPPPVPPPVTEVPTPSFPDSEPRLPVLLGSGLVAEPVQVSTPGPAVFSVRTVVIPPGGTTGWHIHPGTETSIVTAGSIELVGKDACTPVRYDVGAAVFVPDQLPHVVRNDGPVPAELVVTYLLAPDAPDAFEVPPACPTR